jgi:VanZ family protein
LNRVFHHHLWGILWIVFIVLLTALPGRLLPDIPTFMDLFEPDKLVHVVLFAILVILLLRGFARDPKAVFLKNHSLLVALNTGILLGALTELMQKYFIPGRTGSIYDFIANTAGCFVGWRVFAMWIRKRLRASV